MSPIYTQGIGDTADLRMQTADVLYFIDFKLNYSKHYLHIVNATDPILSSIKHKCDTNATNRT